MLSIICKNIMLFKLLLSLIWGKVQDYKWKKILGRSLDETQSEIENRVAKRGVHLLKKQTELYLMLRFLIIYLFIYKKYAYFLKINF